MTYELKDIMTNAWRIRRKHNVDMSEALHRAWQCVKLDRENTLRIIEASSHAGVSQGCRTWSGWREMGFMVRHGERCKFQVTLLAPSKGDGATYIASFFTADQVDRMTDEAR